MMYYWNWCIQNRLLYMQLRLRLVKAEAILPPVQTETSAFL